MQDWRNCSVGIIGCGQIGGALAQRLTRLGMSFKVYDPFLNESSEYGDKLAMLDEVLRQDIITLHVPLTIAAPWPTFHMLNEQTLSRIPESSVVINAARGAVIDDEALMEWLRARATQSIVLDTWENEPNISLQLLQKVQLGTAHIAGYSHEGKLKGTQMLVDQFCGHFGYSLPDPSANAAGIALLHPTDGTSLQQLNQLILRAYDVSRDHGNMLSLLDSASPSQSFDNLRKHYPIRHEFSNFRVQRSSLRRELEPTVRTLGFQLVD